MGITVEKVLSNQKDILLKTQEGHFVEMKSIQILPSKITETLAAFANSDGGELYIGIEENKTT